MKNYLIKISFLMPYPIAQEYRTKASNFSAAVSRALKNWRQDNKGKKIKSLTIKATRL